MFDGLRQFGFIEGQNLTIDWHQYYCTLIGFRNLRRILSKATSMSFMRPGRWNSRGTASDNNDSDPRDDRRHGRVRTGEALARPGRNTTGTSFLSADLDGNRQEILPESVPGLRRIAPLPIPSEPQVRGFRPEGGGARTQRRTFDLPDAKPEKSRLPRTREDVAARKRNRFGVTHPLRQRTIIMQRVAALRLPTIYQFPKRRRKAVLSPRPAYRPSLSRGNGRRLVQLLRGAKPADIPSSSRISLSGHQPQDRQCAEP